MYNRYKPQNDGTFVKRTLPDQPPIPGRPTPFHTPNETSSTVPLSCSPPDAGMHHTQMPMPGFKHNPAHPPIPEPAGSFLKNLIPKDLDTSDLFVILMLLLISGDCPEERNNALLTLALYLLL